MPGRHSFLAIVPIIVLELGFLKADEAFICPTNNPIPALAVSEKPGVQEPAGKNLAVQIDEPFGRATLHSATPELLNSWLLSPAPV
jgi:hypothetical protein